MIRWSHLALATLAALCISTVTLTGARGLPFNDSASVNCGGSGVSSLYCIPQQSVFAFKHVSKASGCSIQVSFTVEPKIQGLSGHAHLELKGVSRQNRNVDRATRPLVTGGPSNYRFKRLSGGAYQLSGWYEGDGTRLPSAHHAKRFTLHCG
jgi:hypothetical protein